jgi:hypothetical protein
MHTYGNIPPRTPRAFKQPKKCPWAPSKHPMALLDISSWDARKSPDGKVSVIDVIAHVTGKGTHSAAATYRRLLREERVPQCSMTPLPPRAFSIDGQFGARETRRRGGARFDAQTPVATEEEIVEIIWQLPGTAEFRRNCAKICVRYLGGDPTLVDEITANRAAQERLAVTNPRHPARMFGRAVERNLGPEAERQLKLSNDQLEISIVAQARQTLLDAGHEIDDSLEWIFRDRIANIVGTTGLQETRHAGQFLAERLPARLVRKYRSAFGGIAARLKRQADGLPPGAQLPRALKNVDGNPTYVVVYKWPEEKELLELAFRELQGRMGRD